MEATGEFLAEDQDPAATAANATATANTIHKRTYQACLPCRHRKVRCDLGSVDEPGDPPCQRCRREKKDCVFSETRRKRKATDEGGEGPELSEDYIARNKRSSTAVRAENDNGLSQLAAQAITSGLAGTGTDNVNNGAPPVTVTPTTPAKKSVDRRSSTRDVKNETAAALFHGPILQPADALSMLVDAASRTETEARRESAGAADREKVQRIKQEAAQSKRNLSIASSGGRSGGHIGGHSGGHSGGAGGGTDGGAAAGAGQTTSTGAKADISPAIIDPAILDMPGTVDARSAEEINQAEVDLRAAMQAWSTVRFVRAGWFTPREAISYIDYWYKHLQPLTPISPPDFSSHASHPRMLAEEPMLTVTLLTITSRYKKLKGPGGEIRSFRIHDKLWDYLQGMITRMFWGQEQFGGGFCGAGASKTVEEVEAKRRGLRSLGTAESLLLLSDWLPRSMHFPPGDDGDELTLPAHSANDDPDFLDRDRNIHAGWTEPAIRSDRMCWSLVGMAYTLSFELGVFDSLIESGRWSPGPQAKTGYDSERADRIGRMLLVYVSQTCGRLGYPNMMPSQGNETNFNFLKMDVPPGTYPGPYDTITTADVIQRAWAELTALMRQSNTEMFESKTRTHNSIQSGEYIEFLKTYGPKLKDWKTRFDTCEVPAKARTMLLMEYEYTRTYVNSLSLQAVVEACAAEAAEEESHPTPNPDSNSAHTPPALFSSKLVDLHKRNRVYIDDLIESSRSLLRLAVDNLAPSGALRHAPVRTHFRILSGAMFLLKSFALGAKESEVFASIALLERTITALRTSVIDDVHLSLRIAELLSGLTTTIRRKFVRLAVPSRGVGKRPGHGSRSSTSKGVSKSAADRRQSNAAAAKSPLTAPQQKQQQQQQAQHRATLSTPPLFSSFTSVNASNNDNLSTTLPTFSSHFALSPGPSGNNINNSQPHLSAAHQGQNAGATPAGQGQDEFYGELGFDLAPPLVDLKDPSITIMPPPDFISNFPNDSWPPPLSPQSATDGSFHHQSPSQKPLSSPTIGNNRPRSNSSQTVGAHNPSHSHGRHGSMSTPTSIPPPPFSPTSTSNNNNQPFSPMSTGSGGGSGGGGGYDWLALDCNPLVQNQNQNGNVHFGFGGDHNTNNNSNHNNNNSNLDGGGDHNMNGGGNNNNGEDGGAGDISSSPWTMGAFGPEISEGLEMLSALGAFPTGWGDESNGTGGVGFSFGSF